MRWVRPKLTEDKIVEWAKAHFKNAGRWPPVVAGPVVGAPGENWGAINAALKNGVRGLPGGETLHGLLRRRVGKTHWTKKPILTVDQILLWAREHFARTGRWPSVISGRVAETRSESWLSVSMAMKKGQRGLPGGTSLSQLLNKVAGPSRSLRKPGFTIGQIVEWARQHRKHTGGWPHPRSGPIRDALGENWLSVNTALQSGLRGLPGGDTLPRLLHRYVGRVPGRRAIHIPQYQILKWADAYHRKQGRWPRAASGPVDGVSGLTWQRINDYLEVPRRGRPGGKSLAKLLCAHRGASARTGRRFELSEVLRWADAFHRRTGRWPVFAAKDHSIRGSWGGIHRALMDGRVGRVPAGTTLAVLLSKHRGVAYRRISRLPLSVEQVLAWADRHHEQTGRWPNLNSGLVAGAPVDTRWSAIDSALTDGLHGLPKGDSLAKLLMQRRGARYHRMLPPLSIKQVLAWADAFRDQFGTWPGKKSGAIPGTTGESWAKVIRALRVGKRGLPGGTALAALLRRERGARGGWRRPILTERQVLDWAVAHHRKTGAWPTKRSGAVGSALNESWDAVNSAVKNGGRGLPRGFTLSRLIDTVRGAQADEERKRSLKLSEVLLWAKAHCRRTGQWPDRYDGRIVDAKGESWFGIDTALQQGLRGLPKGSSLGLIFSGMPKPRPLELKLRRRGAPIRV